MISGLARISNWLKAGLVLLLLAVGAAFLGYHLVGAKQQGSDSSGSQVARQSRSRVGPSPEQTGPGSPVRRVSPSPWPTPTPLPSGMTNPFQAHPMSPSPSPPPSINPNDPFAKLARGVTPPPAPSPSPGPSPS